MSAYETARTVILLSAVNALAGCDFVDRARDRFGNTTTDTVLVTASGGGLLLGLQVPPTLNPGDEGVIRLALTNTNDTAVSNIRLELVVPGWAEPMPPRIGDRPVNMSAQGDGSTLFAYTMNDAPLAPKQLMNIEQRIRVPAAGPMKSGAGAWTRRVRARLLTPDNRAFAQVESEIAVDSAAIAATRTGTDSLVMRDRLGSIQLGMTTAALRQAAPVTRDTSWLEAGARRRGLLVPVAGGIAMAALDQDAVTRIEVTHPSIHTAEGLGVGSSMEQLRATYGLPCAEVNAGRVVVWFASAPGIRFAINAPVANAAQFRDHPDRIANTAQVTRWWLTRDLAICPDQPRGG